MHWPSLRALRKRNSTELAQLMALGAELKSIKNILEKANKLLKKNLLVVVYTNFDKL